VRSHVTSEKETEIMLARAGVLLFTAFCSVCTHAQTITVAGGETIRVATEHDYARAEINFSWKPELWRNENWNLSSNYAVSIAGFSDKNNVYLVSLSPNLILTPADRSGWYPYLQFGIGIALLSDDKFESEDLDPEDDGFSDMGSYAQFETSLALGLARHQLSARIKVYHLSNAGLAEPNGGMDVAELGISYSF
jgi:hypothetical protein